MTNNLSLSKDNFLLSDFIKLNKTIIKTITPHNPSIKKDDEWRNENFWDDLYKEQPEKDHGVGEGKESSLYIRFFIDGYKKGT